jgi:selenocysteine lyase/cysteine desulfurase
MNRRKFLLNSGLALGASSVLPLPSYASTDPVPDDGWLGIRAQFPLHADYIHMAQMLFAAHPKPVRDAIEMYHREFDQHPVLFWEDNWIPAIEKVKGSAAGYLQAVPEEIALTDSTTMGLGILYSGLKLNSEDEILTTTHDHYSSEKALEFAAQKNGASIKRISLYDDPAKASVDEIVERLGQAIGQSTRIVAVTWVHSCTGVKLPIRAMADVIKSKNADRDSSDRIYFCVDGVHGFGVENITMESLGCDFFAAGTHKWLFGPRGTGILWGKRDAWQMMTPTIPAFREAPYGMWMGLEPEGEVSFSDLHSPGGFHAYEHRWALNEAFDFHMKIGKDKIESRTHELNQMLKDGLADMPHINLLTPSSMELSSGINCFEVDGMQPAEVVSKLHDRHIIASTSPYRKSYARLTPCIINTEEEVSKSLEALSSFS